MFWRTLIDIVRNPALLLLHCVVALAMGLITGLVFYDSDMTNIGARPQGRPVAGLRGCLVCPSRRMHCRPCVRPLPELAAARYAAAGAADPSGG